MRQREKPTRKGNDCIILAVPENHDLLAASAVIEEMNISLQVVRSVLDLEKAVSRPDGMLGIIISSKFLGENVSTIYRRIKKTTHDIPIVLAASDTDAMFEKTIRQMGVFYYLLSPYDREEFLSVIAALYSHKARRSSAYGANRSNRKLAKGATQ